MKWYKSSNNLIDDPKLRLCSHKSGVSHYVTVVTLHSLLERCSKNGGAVFGDALSIEEEISFQCGIDIELVKRCMAGFNNAGIISGNTLNNWKKHQSDTNAERQRKFREKQKTVTLRNVTPVTVTQRRGEERRVEEKERKKVVGTRFALQDPPMEWVQFCQTQRPDLDAGMTFDSFKDYWAGVAGANGVKLDWGATWRNWVRNQKQSNNRTMSGVKNERIDRIGEALQRGLDRIERSAKETGKPFG